MKSIRNYQDSIWRVPLIALAAGVLYSPLYVRIVLRFAVPEPGVIDERMSLLISGGLFLLLLAVGGMVLLRKQSRKEILLSAVVLSVYGIAVTLLQLAIGAETGTMAVMFLYLHRPFDWTLFFPSLGFYLENHIGISLPVFGWLRFLSPFLFVLFGRKTASSREEER